jgi:hypothetical protein
MDQVAVSTALEETAAINDETLGDATNIATVTWIHYAVTFLAIVTGLGACAVALEQVLGPFVATAVTIVFAQLLHHIFGDTSAVFAWVMNVTGAYPIMLINKLCPVVASVMHVAGALTTVGYHATIMVINKLRPLVRTTAMVDFAMNKACAVYRATLLVIINFLKMFTCNTGNINENIGGTYSNEAPDPDDHPPNRDESAPNPGDVPPDRGAVVAPDVGE